MVGINPGNRRKIFTITLVFFNTQDKTFLTQVRYIIIIIITVVVLFSFWGFFFTLCLGTRSMEAEKK